MHPFFTVFGKTIPAYGLMGVCGFILGLLYVVLMSKPRDLDRDNAVYIYCMGGIGALIGAKLLFLILAIPDIMKDLPMLFSDTGLFLARYFRGGMVLYGGLLGAVIAAAGTAKSYRVSFSDYCRVLIPAAALTAGMGRIGCFLAGCCYGIETDLPIGVVFSSYGMAPHHVPLVPVQLMEAAFDFGMAAALSVAARRSKRILPVFMLSYSVMRFFIEFIRGDAARGFIGPLSTSQWISLAVFSAALIWLICQRARMPRADT